jgi:hypothetical protein
MSLVEGDERAAIPSMSWSSVVGDEAVDVKSDSGSDVATDPGPPATSNALVDTPLSFQMTSLIDDEKAAPEPTSTPPPPPPPVAFAMGTTAATDDQPTSTVLHTASKPAEPDTTVSSARPGTSAPLPDATPLSLSIPPVSETSTVPQTGDPEPVALPPIVEATPPESVSQAVEALHTESMPVVDQPTPIAPPEPVVTIPPAPAANAAVQPTQAGLSLPRAVAASAVPLVSPADEQAPRKPKERKDRSTALARLGFFVLFIAAVVSAGVIFGRPYLFSAEWEDNALPYAEAVEQVRGTEFVEPVLLTAQDNATHRDLVSEQLLGDAQERLPMWRALGLAGPDATDNESLRDLTSAQSPVLYSTADGQVYYDQSFNQAHRDQLITQAMATAAIGQDVTFWPGADQGSLDANALTDAHVLQQAATIAELASPTTVPVPEPDVAALAFLPPVLDYRLTGPVVLSAVLPPVNDVAPNPLEGNGPEGPARNSALGSMSAASIVAGDVSVGETVPMDRGFWYLVFASHLDATTAYDMSNTLERVGLQTVRAADGRTCAVANFATVNGADNERLGVSLDAWTANVAPELGASVDSLPDTTVQLRSCDPAGAFASNARFGVSRELIGWRATETVVVGTLTAEGADDATIARGLTQIGTTASVQNLISLPAGTPPSEVAAAVRDAAADVVAATVTPPVADAGG